MFGLTVVMIAIGLTICIVKPHARSFALIVLVAGLAGRLATIVTNKAAKVPTPIKRYYVGLAIGAVVLSFVVSYFGDSKYAIAGFDVPGLGRRTLVGGEVAFLLSATLAGLIGYGELADAGITAQAILDAEAAAHAARHGPGAEAAVMIAGGYTPKERIMVADAGQPPADRLRDQGVQEPPGRAATPLRPPPGRHADGADRSPRSPRTRTPWRLFDRVREQAKAGASRSGCSTASPATSPTPSSTWPSPTAPTCSCSWAPPAAARSGRP